MVESSCFITAAFVHTSPVTSYQGKIRAASELEVLDMSRFCTSEWTGMYLALSPTPNKFHTSMDWSERDLK